MYKLPIIIIEQAYYILKRIPGVHWATHILMLCQIGLVAICLTMLFI